MAFTSPRKTTSLWKGKDRDIDEGESSNDNHDEDYTDLNPAITYRHLHSHNLGVKDPLRVIALCDSDAFYAACEQVRLGIDPSEPLVVQQWESLIAVNYPARKFGISRMDKVMEAKKRCPHLRVVHVATFREGDSEPGYWDDPTQLTHKVSLDHYRRESMKIIQMFKEGLPEGEIERASIDEAFIDFTKPVRDEILKRYPYLNKVPRNTRHGKDTPLPPPPPIVWSDESVVVPLVSPGAKDKSDQVTTSAGEAQSTSQPEEEEENTGQGDVGAQHTPYTWHDVALSIGAGLMAKIRLDIYTKLGYTTSAGIARNKFLAKLTASYKKPNSQSILRNAAIPNYLRPLPFQKIRFLGGKLGKAIAEEYDVSTVSDLLPVTLEEMQRKFGEDSIWVYEILRGVDLSEVKEKSAVTKSMLAAKSLPQPIIKGSQRHHWIRVLAAELALRLKEGREAAPGLWPKSIVLNTRQGYTYSSRSKQAPFPFTRDPTADVIAAAGDRLWKEMFGTEESKSGPLKITFLSLSFSGIDTMESGQRNIEGFFVANSGLPPDFSSGSSLKRKREEVEVADKGGESTRASLTASPPPSRGSSFWCPRCKKPIPLPKDLATVDDNDIKDAALTALGQEHDDWHFAQDLSRQPESDTAVSGPPKHTFRPQSTTTKPVTNKPASKGKKPKEKSTHPSQGIAQFFNKS